MDIGYIYIYFFLYNLLTLPLINEQIFPNK